MLLRVNADPAEIIKQLEDIESDTIWFEGSTIKSIPDAIAYAMDSWREEPKRGLLHVEGIVDTESDLIIQNEDTSSYIVIPCKECGGMMMMQENCPTCQNCGIQDCN